MNDCLSDKYIILTLKDNGVDVSEDVKERITILIVHELSSEHLTHYKNLKFVQIYGRGTDKVCVSELDKGKIYYQNCCSAHMVAEAIAEYVLFQILYWERNVPKLIEKGMHGDWSWGVAKYIPIQGIKPVGSRSSGKRSNWWRGI